MVFLSTEEAEDLHKCKKWIYDNVEWEPRGKFQYFKVVVITKMRLFIISGSHLLSP